MKKILLILLLLSLTNCASQKTKSHMSTVIGATAGYGTCRALLNSGIGLTAACTVVGALVGSSIFYNDDMNIHKAVFVDTLNTSPGKRSHTTWGSNTSGNWGSITINRTYLKKGIKCSEYESVISIERSWPMYGIQRENEFGVACQVPDGRWYIQ
jgi:surface antigen|tara:strand:- start:19 stop:483 length:465 start_codon:yes stop_codon:yes gene_type:complete